MKADAIRWNCTFSFVLLPVHGILMSIINKTMYQRNEWKHKKTKKKFKQIHNLFEHIDSVKMYIVLTLDFVSCHYNLNLVVLVWTSTTGKF